MSCAGQDRARPADGGSTSFAPSHEMQVGYTLKEGSERLDAVLETLSSRYECLAGLEAMVFGRGQDFFWQGGRYDGLTSRCFAFGAVSAQQRLRRGHVALTIERKAEERRCG